MNDRQIDKILVSILQRRFKSITEEMSIALAMTTRSPILCEAKDFGTGLYDARGRMLEQTENLPILSFSLAPVCQYIIKYYGDDIHPGDVIFHNDVFSLGNQNNDVAVYKPIFHGDTLVAWAACKGHQADMGGAVQGGYNPHATEVWQEALRIPPVKVYERGKLRKDVWDLIFANIRLDIVAEDMRAEIGSCVVGERGILKLVERYGLEKFERHKEYLFDSTEKMLKAEIRNIPNGVYYGESRAYYDGVIPGSVYTIRVRITVEDEHIRFDYSGTDAQTKGFMNGTYTSSASATILTFLQMVNPDIPHNDGMIRPIEIEHSGRHAAQRGLPGGHDLRQPPLSQQRRRHHARPVAGHPGPGDRRMERTALFTDHGHRSPEERAVRGHLFHGAEGRFRAIRGADGYDHIGMIDASGGVLDQDYEMFEQQTPHRLLRHEYWTDSAGAGRWRGGLGVISEYVVGSDAPGWSPSATATWSRLAGPRAAGTARSTPSGWLTPTAGSMSAPPRIWWSMCRPGRVITRRPAAAADTAIRTPVRRPGWRKRSRTGSSAWPRPAMITEWW
jgi:N-methylhydantoinase B